jgi:hypothetical protein
MTGRRQTKQTVSLVLAALFLVLAVPPALRAESVVVRSAGLELNPEQPAASQLGALTYLGGLILAVEKGQADDQFGGYSGLAVDPDGAGLWAISDLGHWLRLDFDRAATGIPAAIAAAQILPLRDANGAAITRKLLNDAEGLRHLPDGRWLVSFERAHRLWFFDRPGDAASGLLAAPPAISAQPENGGIEAFASLPGGDLLLFSEDAPAVVGGTGDSAAWLWRDGAWHDMAWPARDDFRPTDAVALPNGDVLVLQRFYKPLIGPKARLSRIAADGIRPGAVLQATLVAEWASPYSVDNMEALDLRRADDGSIWLYVMSDDNRSTMQRTLLMVFRLAS